MKRISLIIVAVLIFMTTAGCYRTVYTGENLGYLVTLNKPKPGEAIVEHFSETLWNHYFLGGLFPTSTIDIAENIKMKVSPGHAVRNLTIRHQETFGNIVVGVLTFGIYTPLATIIEGDIVKASTNSSKVVQAR